MISSILVLYGSQTGNAQVLCECNRWYALPVTLNAPCKQQDVAERISRESRVLYFSPRIMPLDTYDVTSLPRETAVVFVVSTAGQVDAGGMCICCTCMHLLYTYAFAVHVYVYVASISLLL
jgi:sulfite reductase alpha subunit-like flavoprotein